MAANTPETDFSYAGGSPDTVNNITDYTTPAPMRAHGAKIAMDLARWARLVSGKQARFYTLSKTTRCPKCTDALTGAVLVSKCNTCLGTGYQAGYTLLDDYWVVPNFSPVNYQATEMGNSYVNGVRDEFLVYGAPVLKDRDIFIMVDTKSVYRIQEVAPHIGAIQGVVVGQQLQCMRLGDGCFEYKLIDW